MDCLVRQMTARMRFAMECGIENCYGGLMKQTDTFSDRRKAAETAKARLLEKFKTRPAPDSPEALERAAALQAQNAAQAERNAAIALKKKLKLETLRIAAEAAEAARLSGQQAAARIEKAASEKLRKQAEAKELQDEAARKALRDARYAKRKAKG